MDAYLIVLLVLVLALCAGLFWYLDRALPERQPEPAPVPIPSARERLDQTQSLLANLRLQTAGTDGSEAESLLLDVEAEVNRAEAQLRQQEFAAALAQQKSHGGRNL
jgi:hypothetical protein